MSADQVVFNWHPKGFVFYYERMRQLLGLIFALLIGTFPLFAQTQKPSADAIPQPREVTYCELSREPAAHNHELVRLTAFVTHGFEDFHIADPTCHTLGFSVWVMYGGKAQSGTAYCCPGETGDKTRSEPLTVEGVQIPLVDDSVFGQFTNLLAKEPDTTARVTVVGRFFSGEKRTINGATSWGGAGHMGCCSLFVIQRVESFEQHTRNDLDYTSEAGWYEKEGCKYGQLQYRRHVSLQYMDGVGEQVIAEQKKADSGEAAWAFTDPQRVAADSLKPFFPGQVPVLRSVKKTPARQVFRWKNGNNQVVVVVTRPYWLSFYAASHPVVWVSTMIKEAGCD
ncbi:MAG: hypothetical protein ACLPOO_15415 [Terriglobales bacterium]